MTASPYSAGSQAAWRQMLGHCLTGLRAAGGTTEDEWRLERARVVALLRTVCEEHGDNDWPDDLDLCDVIDKHLVAHLQERAEELRELELDRDCRRFSDSD